MDWLRNASRLGGNGGCRVVFIDHHHVRINLLGQLHHAKAILPILITTISWLLMSSNLYKRVIGQGNLVWIPKGGGVRETDCIHCYHPTLLKPELLSLENYCICRVFGIFIPHVVKEFLTSIHYLLQVNKLFVMSGDNARCLGEFDFDLPEFAL